MRPDDIPEDVWEAAKPIAAKVFNAYHDDDGCLGLGNPIGIVARAILVERERLTDPAFLERHLTTVGVVGAEAVDEAVSAERERCARIAEKAFPPAHTYASENADVYRAQDAAAARIAAAIRSP